MINLLQRNGGLVGTKRTSIGQVWDSSLTHIVVPTQTSREVLCKKLFTNSLHDDEGCKVVTLQWLQLVDKNKSRLPESDHPGLSADLPPALAPAPAAGELPPAKRQKQSSSISSEWGEIPAYAPVSEQIHAEAPRVSVFTQVLRPYADSPSLFPATVYLLTRNFVVIYDRYPKASRHVLILPRDGYIDAPMGVRQLGPEHRDRVQEMHSLAQAIAAAWSAEAEAAGEGTLKCLIGYHATPSLHTLHLHVLTADLDSPALKKKIHWNSFTTPFFVPAALVDSQIGQPQGCREMALAAAACEEHDGPMRCPLCKSIHSTIPAMKSHYQHCLMNSNRNR